jgi:hypothetical protein
LGSGPKTLNRWFTERWEVEADFGVTGKQVAL